MSTLLSPAARRALTAVAFASLAVSGCRCGPPTTNALSPDYLPNPTALSFEACPTKDANGATVKDVFPDTKKVVIDNRAKVAGGLKLTITGTDKDAFSLPATLPEGIEQLGSVEIPVSFSPTKSGDMRAQLVIDDLADGTPDQTVTLVGAGKTLPALPTLETGPQTKEGTSFQVCTPDSPIYPDCSLEFPDTMFNKESTLKLRIKNKGCPTLKVTDLSITSSAGDDQGFSIVSPAQLPSSGTPLLLNSADGTDVIDVVVKFAPLDMGAGSDGQRTAVLSIKSNDQLYGDGLAGPSAITLMANAVKPSLYVTPTMCDFSNPLDPCGASSAATKLANEATFRITNEGSTDVRIDSTTFDSTGSATSGISGRFTIPTSIVGQTIPKLGSLNLTVKHVDQPIYVGDKLTIAGTAIVAGQPNGSAGSVTVALFGGTKPKLITDPTDRLDFNNPANELTAQSVFIKNGPDAGTLVVQSVSIDPNPFFSLIDPQVAANTQIPSGGSAEATVQYKRPSSGGNYTGTLRIKTNDSDYAPEKIILLSSQSPLLPVPTAVLTGCRPDALATDPQCAAGFQTTMSANYSQLTAKEITFSGVSSYAWDPAAPTTKKAPAKYKFSLLPGAGGAFPPGVTTANLANSGQQVTTPTTKLTIPAGGTGTYRVQLIVYDDRAQASTPVLLTLSVYP